MRLKLPFAALIAVNILASCGDNPQRDLSASTGESLSTTSSIVSPEVPDGGEPPSVPRVSEEELLTRFATNKNIRDGEIGSVCWARWEVARHLLQADTAGDDDNRRSRAMADLEARFGDVIDELERAEQGVPSAIGEFVQDFRSAVEGAQRATSEAPSVEAKRDATVAELNWEQFRGVDEYGEAAQKSPNCVRA